MQSPNEVQLKDEGPLESTSASSAESSVDQEAVGVESAELSRGSPELCSEKPSVAVDLDAAELGESLTLRDAALRVGIDLEPAVLEGVEAYCQTLWSWNTRLNLTKHTNYDLFARRDLLDTYKLSLYLKPDTDILDIGTGGGVPGVLLAILRPDLTLSVCDSVTKKAKAVAGIVKELSLPVGVYPTRAEEILEDMRFHTLVTRAAGSISQLLTWLRDHWLSFDTLLAIKGPRWVDERKEARHRGLLNGIELRRLEAYHMPGTKNESVILSLTKPR